MSKTFLIRLPDWAGEEIVKTAERRGQGYATVIKGIVCECLRDEPAENPTKTTAGTTSTTA